MRLLTTFFLFAINLPVIAQQPKNVDAPSLPITKDTTSIISAFLSGHVSGQFRYFFMATDNRTGLSDYYANSIGGGIKYETAAFHKFKFGISNYFAFNIGSSDLTKPDPQTGQLNRYEIGLFDIQNPGNKKDINRLEELYFKYEFKNSSISFGKQLLNSSFINLQDGRMRPTAVKGLWAEINQIKNTKIQLGYLYAISPRSTIKWFKTASSIGLYPVGVNEFGIKSGYAGNLKSNGIILTGISHQFNQGLKIQLFNQFTENIFNSLLIQSDFEKKVSPNSKITGGLQVIRQDAINNGGNSDPLKSYTQKGNKALVIGGRIGWKNSQWESTLNYTRITAHGRYLMPREWGKDPFFTFLPRERNEGFGDVNAFMGKVNYKLKKVPFSASVGIGHYSLPDVNNYLLNKYGIPSYNQLNIDLRYKFSDFLKGFDIQLLYVHKNKTGTTYGNEKFVINKVDMSNWNLVINFQF